MDKSPTVNQLVAFRSSDRDKTVWPNPDDYEIPAKTTRKAATMRFVASPLVLGCIKGSYAGLFRGLNFNLNF